MIKMFNIYVYDGKTKIPDETCYIIAKGGIYLNKKLDLISSLTPVDKISFLDDLPSFASIDIEKIPVGIFGKIIGFFKKIYEMYKSESIVLLYYNKDKNSFKIQVPEQEVSGASLSYQPCQSLKDHILIGSIHSHANMSAFHSGTDVGDEEGFDGIHFTIGKLGDELFDCCASIAINGFRVKIDPIEYVEGLEKVENTPYLNNNPQPSFEEKNDVKIFNYFTKTSSGYRLNSKSKKVFEFNKEWLEKVKEKAISFITYGGSAGVRYKWEAGKLVKIEEDTKNNTRSIMGSSKIDYTNLNDLCENSNYNYNNNSCKNCIHRHDRVEIEDLKKELNINDQEDNFEWWYF